MGRDDFMILIGKGRQAEVYDMGDGTCLKLFYQPEDKGDAEREAHKTKYACEHGLSAPKCYGVENHDGRWGIRMEKLTGETMLSEALRGEKPIEYYAEIAAREQKALHSVSGAGFEDMTEGMDYMVKETPLLTDSEKAFICEKIAAMPKGDRLVHRDYHMDNIFMTDKGARVIDWTGAAMGDPLADAAQTLMNTEAHVYPVYADEQMKTAIDEMRARCAKKYLEVYGVTREELREWMPLVAATRLICAPEGELEDALSKVKAYLAAEGVSE